jgi:FKBP-type peptidyl-prolyl cis-trans isomerase FkpA
MMKHLSDLGISLVLLALTTGIAQAASPFLATPGGAVYQELKPGSGEVAAIGDVATLHFIGWLDDQGNKGRELYNTRRDGGPVSFVIGTDRVMPGWNDGVIGMRPGGKRLVRLPSSLAYGDRGVEDVVPPGAGLIFVIDLVGLEK